MHVGVGFKLPLTWSVGLVDYAKNTIHIRDDEEACFCINVDRHKY